MWWFLFGIVLGVGILAVVLSVRARKIAVRWYEWLMGAVALILALLILQNFLASYAEHEPRAAWMGVLFMGIPCAVLAVLAMRLPRQRRTRIRA